MDILLCLEKQFWVRLKEAYIDGTGYSDWITFIQKENSQCRFH